MAASARASSGWLVLLRLYAGFFWAQHGIDKLRSPDWATPNGTMVQILQSVSKETSGPYHDFLVNTVLPNSVLFANLVAWGETLAGVSLFLGLLTKVGGLVGALLPLNYFFSKGAYNTLDGYTGYDMLAVVMSLACVVLPVSSTFSLDSLFFRRKRVMRVGTR